jgi:cation-transporting ATPase E
MRLRPPSTADTAGPAAEAWPAGLTGQEASRRRARGLGNATAIRGSVSVRRVLRRNVFTILNGVLFSVALVLLALGLLDDALVTAGPVAANVGVAVVLELRAKRKLDRLTLLNRPAVTIRRDGSDRHAPAAEIVLGDVLVLERGDQAVVDGRVVAGSLEADESILTGEADAVAKGAGDRLLSGSVCVAGRAAMEATEVGDATFASKLATEARHGSDERTPLRRDLDTLILAIGILTVLAAVPVGLALRASGETFLSTASVQAAAVLVALVPQGLAIMATVAYSLAAVRVGRAGAIVQRLDAMEAMARVDTLCLDKTGTLTSHDLVMAAVRPLDGVTAGAVEDLLRDVAASATARNRTLDAIAAALPGPPLPLVDEVPFSSERRWSAVVLASDGATRTFVLGAPEALAPAGPHARLPREVIADLADRGWRVLVFAEAGDAARDGERVGVGDPRPDLRRDGEVRLPPALRPLAILGFTEAIRPDARATLDELRAAGVGLRVVSGDSPDTVAAVATSLGVEVRGVLDGAQVEALSDEDLPAAADPTTVFGRIRPADKRRVVTALRRAGHYVAMTGDGVNDVLALRQAQLGIAMESGSAAARAVAGLILVGDRFAVLPRAIVEGQRVVSSMIAVGCLLLARTVYMLLIVVAAAFLALPFPFTPKNNAVLALLTVGIPTLVMAFWAPPVRSPRSVVWRVLRFAVPYGVAVAALAVPVMVDAFAGGDVTLGRTIVTTATVFTGLALIPLMFPAVPDRAGPIGPGGDRRPTILALVMLALYALLTATPAVREFFDLVALPLDTTALLLAYTGVFSVGIFGAQHVVARYRAPREA